MKTIGLIQARMGSLRLPGKVMMPLAGRPVVWHILDRLRRVTGVSEVVLATTQGPENEPLAKWGEAEGLVVVRHPRDDDIAGRMALAVSATNADVVVKINADCPLADPNVISATLDLLRLDPAADGASNKLRPTFPLGLSVEVLKRDVIAWCHGNLSSAGDRELMVKWVFEHPERFRILSLESAASGGRYNLTLDTPADYALISAIFDGLFVPGHCFGWREVNEFLVKMPNVPACAYLPVPTPV
jgi:spore coat polysaccharide biosynthesis protein SpsF